MEYKIEKNVPTATRRWNRKWMDLAGKMNVGDSVIVSNHNVRVNLASAIRKSGYDAQTAALNGKDAGKYRVWKLEKK